MASPRKPLRTRPWLILGQWDPRTAVTSLMVLLLWLDSVGAERTDSCAITNNGLYLEQTRYFYYNSTEQSIILEDSGRVSHRIANWILKFLLEEVAGYQMVELHYCPSFNSQNASILLDRVSGRKASKHCQPPRPNNSLIPETMVNLEVWMYAGFNKAAWLKSKETSIDRLLLDAGPLGPQGRMGWFIPNFLIDKLWRKSRKIVDHWRALRIETITPKLSWWGKPDLKRFKLSYKDGAYLNPRCWEDAKGRRKKCATLFASYKDMYSETLEHQITNLDLYVDIVWLNDQLPAFVRRQVKKGQPVLFFNWNPNTLLATGQFTRIKFPETHTDHQDAPVDCDFPVNQLTKVAWLPLRDGAPEAFHIVSHMSFTDAGYKDILLDMAKGSRSPQEVACQWVRNNTDTWHEWLPQSLREKTPIFLGGLFPLTGQSWAQPGLVEGAKLAVKRVNGDPSVLGNQTLELLVRNTRCQDDIAISQFISLVQDHERPVAAIVGAGCSDPAERVASLSKHFHLLMVSYGAEAETLSNQEKYPYFFRTVPPSQHYTNVYPNLFLEMGWDVIGALTEDGHKLADYHLTLQTRLKNHGISLIVKRKYVNNSSSPTTAQILKDFKSQNVHVIIADVFSHSAREIMCEAFKQKMTASDGYLWFLPSWYGQDWWDVDFYNSRPGHLEQDSRMESVPCTTAQLRVAIEGHFVLSKTFTAPPTTMVEGGISVKEYKEQYALACGKENVEESNFASFAYDAVWVLAKGLDALLKKDHGALETLHTKKTADAFRAAIRELNFSGVSGQIQFDGSDRYTDMVVLQSFSNETLVIGHYISDGQEAGGTLKLDTSAIRWLSPLGHVLGKAGKGEESCGSLERVRTALGFPCTVVWLMFVAVPILIVIILIVVFIKMRCDARIKKFRAAHERIKELGLLTDENSHILVVDDWEIPRNNIVLNRPLGEGAFCTVKGGEMYKEGEGWVSVAVKTLKSDFKTEEKLEFLREIGLMKQFKHQNIVQLRGVCTRREPIYAVMEFMLHGNLKTYLLSRRSLVGQGVKEAEDVKAETLTQMALDIADGLFYLHANKFVHRDLACRNCLVHANKRVKIGDFGMTRHISDTDHYRFTRKALLPIRWTAPESLRDGIYTAKSDIWSFGVLMYEIVTLGSFPYAGLSNREVLDYVIRGNPLPLPETCPSALKSFISWCTRHDPYSRPELDDIASSLQHTPTCLSPCLDAPAASVAHEDTDSLEMQDLPQTFLVSSNGHGGNATGSSLAFVAASRSRSHSWHDKSALGVSMATAGGGGGGVITSALKKKPFSMLGLASSLGKVGRKSGASSSNRQCPSPSLLRSSSLCSGGLLSSSVCGLNSCSASGGGASRSVPANSSFSYSGETTIADIHGVRYNTATAMNSFSQSEDAMQTSLRRDSQEEAGEEESESVSMLDRSRDAPSSDGDDGVGIRTGISEFDVVVNVKHSEPSLNGDASPLYLSALGSDAAGEMSSGYFSQNSKADLKPVRQTVTSL